MHVCSMCCLYSNVLVYIHVDMLSYEDIVTSSWKKAA